MNKQQLTAEASNPLPFWQTEPCPSWCDMATGPHRHKNSDYHDDRHHFRVSTDVPLTLLDGSPYGNDGDAEQLHLNVSAVQHYRAAAPDVVLSVPVLDKRRDFTEHDVHMTVAEACALRDRLAELLGMLGEDGDR